MQYPPTCSYLIKMSNVKGQQIVINTVSAQLCTQSHTSYRRVRPLSRSCSVCSLCASMFVWKLRCVAAAVLYLPRAAPRPSAEASKRDGADSLRVVVLQCYYAPSFRMSCRSTCHLLLLKYWHRYRKNSSESVYLSATVTQPDARG